MKKFILTTLVVIIIAAILTGCSTTMAQGGYDRRIIEKANAELEANPALYTAEYEVEYNGNSKYTVKIQGEVSTVQVPEPLPKENIGKNATPVTEGDCWNLLEKSKKKVIDYIMCSEIISNKESLCQKISDIPLMMADSTSPMEDALAFYDTGCIYVLRKNQKFVCEWMFVHELIHYLCELTNNATGEHDYQRTDFNEAMTDVITASINPSISRGIQSMYTDYYSECYQYIGIFGEDAIKAYFYGYSDIWEKVGKNEFDFWVLSFGRNMLENAYAYNCVYVTLTKWQNVILGR